MMYHSIAIPQLAVILLTVLASSLSCCWGHQSCFLYGVNVARNDVSSGLRHEQLRSATGNPVLSNNNASNLARIQTKSSMSISRKHTHNNKKLSSHLMAKQNNIPEYFFNKNKTKQEEEIKDQDESKSKRGVFRRVRDRISNTFSGMNNNNEENNNNNSNEPGYKPNIIDTLRLQMAKAMSGISNLPLFQRSRDEWVVACPKTRVGPGQITPCVVNGLDIIIFASRDGSRLDAFANSCPHLGSPFDLGTIERKESMNGRGDGTGDGCVDCIVCPVHRTAFEIQSGQVQGEWCPYPPIIGGVMGYVKPKSGLVKFAVRLKGKNVEVRIATPVENVEKGDDGAKGLTNIK